MSDNTNVHEGLDLIGASRSPSVEMLTAKPEQLESFGENMNIKTVTEGLWFLWGKEGGAVQVCNHGEGCFSLPCVEGCLGEQLQMYPYSVLMFIWSSILFSKANRSAVWPVESVKKVHCVIQSIVVVFSGNIQMKLSGCHR